MLNHKWTLLFVILMLAALFTIGCGCGDDSSDEASAKSDDDDDDDDDDNDDDDDDDDDDTTPKDKYMATLTFEMRGSSELYIEKAADNSLTGVYKNFGTYDVIEADTEMNGIGSYYEFGGQLWMYSLKFTGPVKSDSPCGSEKLSYSVTLTAKQDNKYVSGGFAVYCGDNTFTGRPVRVYRVAGDLNPVD